MSTGFGIRKSSASVTTSKQLDSVNTQDLEDLFTDCVEEEEACGESSNTTETQRKKKRKNKEKKVTFVTPDLVSSSDSETEVIETCAPTQTQQDIGSASSEQTTKAPTLKAYLMDGCINRGISPPLEISNGQMDRGDGQPGGRLGGISGGEPGTNDQHRGRLGDVDEYLGGARTWEQVAAALSLRVDKHILVEIYRRGDEELLGSFLQGVEDESKRRAMPHAYRQEQFIFVARHDKPGFDHYHCLHMCAWTNSTCRCGRLQSLKQHCLVFRKSIPVNRLETKDIIGLLLYHWARPKILVYGEEVGRRRGIYSQSRTLQEGRSPESTCPGLAEICNSPLQGALEQVFGPGESTGAVHSPDREQLGTQGHWCSKSAGTNARDDGVPSSKGPVQQEQWMALNERLCNRKYKIRALDLVLIMKRFLHCPVNGLLYSADWFQIERLTEINHTGLLYDNAVRLFRSEINEMSVTDLYDLQTEGCATPTFSAGSSNKLNECYWPIKQSVYMLLDLLHYQFRGDLDLVKGF